MTPVICWARWSSPRCNTPAMSRADMAEPSRRDFWLYVDEFQNFATESFATILSEGAQVSTRLDPRYPDMPQGAFVLLTP